MNRNDAQLPLVTFVLLVYNQAAYLPEAIEAALQQTYPHLEILISDDASTDNSANVAASMLRSYHGKHVTRLNVNSSNLGMGNHVNKVFGLARGSLVVLAAGDDISFPNRTSMVVERWLSYPTPPSAIYCRALAIDSHGVAHGHFRTALGEFTYGPAHLISYDNPRRLLLLGACAAYTPDVLRKFGPLFPKLVVEDIPLTVRASLLNGVAVIDDALVKYRVNVSVWLPRKLANEDFLRHIRRMTHRIHANYWVSRQILADTLVVGDDAAIRAARRRHTATAFALRTCKRRRLIFSEYFAVGRRSGHWRLALIPSFLFAVPWIHKLLFQAKQVLRTRQSA
jgi:glycosyltransferase involved in cell wall biosynthesis